jgi:hypothetical protein
MIVYAQFKTKPDDEDIYVFLSHIKCLREHLENEIIDTLVSEESEFKEKKPWFFKADIKKEFLYIYEEKDRRRKERNKKQTKIFKDGSIEGL